MGIGCGIHDQGLQLPLGVQTACLVNPFHQLALMVALAELQLQAMAHASPLAELLDIGQRGRAVDGGFAHAQQIEIRAIEDIDGFHGSTLLIF
ncbi:hypothetical protein SDC9_204144 [bioreactor metagenome]|uniref:Uncharacterized protein n=1 Tax=bioreactor metagenome TaxID=1076179 RepID=A0A645IYD1_9ZZZZ